MFLVVLTNFGKDLTHKKKKRNQKRVIRVYFHFGKMSVWGVFWKYFYKDDI